MQHWAPREKRLLTRKRKMFCYSHKQGRTLSYWNDCYSVSSDSSSVGMHPQIAHRNAWTENWVLLLRTDATLMSSNAVFFEKILKLFHGLQNINGYFICWRTTQKTEAQRCEKYKNSSVKRRVKINTRF